MFSEDEQTGNIVSELYFLKFHKHDKTFCAQQKTHFGNKKIVENISLSG
jgi:hypothetical protein